MSHSLTQTLTEPDDVNPENTKTQTKRNEDWGLGYDVTAGVNLNFWNRLSAYGGVRYLHSFGLEEPLGSGGATIDPEYVQAYAGVGMSLSWIGKLTAEDPERPMGASLLGGSPSPATAASVVVAARVELNPGFDIFNPAESLIEEAFDGLFDSVTGTDYSETVVAGTLVDLSGERVEAVPVHLRDSSNVLLFAGVAPGVYRLSEVTVYYDLGATEQDEYYDPGEAPSGLLVEFKLPKSSNLRFDLRAGETRYVGDLMLVADETPPLSAISWERPVYVFGRWNDLPVDEGTIRPDGDVVIESDRDKEIAAMEALVREFDENPWSARWEVRAQDLRAVAS